MKPSEVRNPERRWFINQLLAMWRDAYGEWPKRKNRRNADGGYEECGPFFLAARACIEPICPGDLEGLDDEIRERIKEGKAST